MKSALTMTAVIAALAVAAAMPASAVYSCPRGYVCVYEHANWEGSYRSWPAYRTDSLVLGGPYTDWPGLPDFRNQVSSWSNNSIYRWCVYDALNLRPDVRLWQMDPTTWERNVPSLANDKADYAKRC